MTREEALEEIEGHAEDPAEQPTIEFEALER